MNWRLIQVYLLHLPIVYPPRDPGTVKKMKRDSVPEGFLLTHKCSAGETAHDAAPRAFCD